MTQYKPRDLVNLISPHTFLLKANNRNFKVDYIGSLVVYKIIDKFQYILRYIEGKVLNGIFSFNRLKQAYLRTIKDPVSKLADMKQIINLGNKINDKKELYECFVNEVFSGYISSDLQACQNYKVTYRN